MSAHLLSGKEKAVANQGESAGSQFVGDVKPGWKEPERHCMNSNSDVCLAGNATGICCGPDDCDIEDGMVNRDPRVKSVGVEYAVPGADISPCGTWRYRLWRPVMPTGIVVAFFGVNPSTADAIAEDSTTRKWKGFAARMGARAYIAGNPFSFRATNVRELGAAADPIGPENASKLGAVIAAADILVPCWGNRSKVPKYLRHHLDALQQRLFASGKPVHTFGFTGSGDPMHPLMLAYETPVLRWTP